MKTIDTCARALACATREPSPDEQTKVASQNSGIVNSQTRAHTRARARARARRTMRVLLLVPLLLSAAVVLLPPTAHAAHARAVQQEERLIGWLGEVPRPQLHDGTPAGTDTVVGPGGATAAAGFPEHDASDLDTDFIGVGNPNVEKLSDEPKAYLYHGFLSPEEAAHLVKIGEPHLKRSTVVGGKTEKGEDSGLTDDVRTSHGTFIPKEYDDVVYAVEKRVEQYSQISYENQEQLQLLRYHVGEQYKDHMDGLFSENGGKRIATVLMFLHEPDSGGETSFPHGKPLPAVKEKLRGMQNQLSQCGWRDGGGTFTARRVVHSTFSVFLISPRLHCVAA